MMRHGGAAGVLMLIAPAAHAGSPPAVSAPAARTIVVGRETIPDVGFEVLASFPYTIVDAGTGAAPEQIAAAQKRDQVPAVIRALHGRRVALTGYMLPTQLENGRVKKFILMRDVQTCCFGATPNMNDYVVVSLKGAGATALADIPVVVVGTLHVGEKYEGGYLVSLFELEGDTFLGARK